MSFRPFGDPFDISSPLPPERVKTVIRTRKKPWFETASGARGWVAGPFLCLWLSAFDRYGPMLIGRISADGAGSRVTGLAGSGLNGLISALLVIPIGLFALWMLFLEQGPGVRGLLVAAFLIGLLTVNLWVRHADRKQAEPLLRFLRDAASPSKNSIANGVTDPALLDGIEMDVSGVLSKGQVTATRVREALGGLGEGDSLILSLAGERYIQVLGRNGAFVVEKREGGADRHFRAEPLPARETGQAENIPFDDAVAALLSWASVTPCTDPVKWRRIRLRNG